MALYFRCERYWRVIDGHRVAWVRCIVDGALVYDVEEALHDLLGQKTDDGKISYVSSPPSGFRGFAGGRWVFFIEREP